MIFLNDFSYVIHLLLQGGSIGSLVFKELPVLEYIHFIYHVPYVRDLRETHIYTNTVLK